MVAHALHRSRWSLVAFAAVAVLAGCEDETALGPTERPAIAASRDGDLGECDEINVPEGSKLVFRAYAEGVQIYQWDGTTWAFGGPSASLYADAAGTATIGTHYDGPTWESNSGSLVVGRLNTPCEVGTADIPWLLLDGIRSEGPGIFHRVAFIQRVNTVGGRAPTTAGSPGEVRNVPYTAEYFFYRAP
jgi:uncharacterized protein DUF3455